MAEQKPLRLAIKDDGKVDYVFVSDIASSGVQNGVVNMTLVTAYFTPEGTDIDDIKPDLRISARLRMDMYAVGRLRSVCDELLRTASAPKPTGVN